MFVMLVELPHAWIPYVYYDCEIMYNIEILVHNVVNKMLHSIDRKCCFINFLTNDINVFLPG